MILYHGSLEIVEHPLIREANRPLDFGTGFYTTTSLQQARRWVKLRMEQNNASVGYINIYEYTPKKGLRTRRFRSANEAWQPHRARLQSRLRHCDRPCGKRQRLSQLQSIRIRHHLQARTYPSA